MWEPQPLATLRDSTACIGKTLTFTWYYIPEDRTLYNHPYENLKSYKIEIIARDAFRGTE
jgi:hypothetical protein